MQRKVPKNTEKYYWTQHVVNKMHYYGLSEQKILGIIRRPRRVETGIATDTVAVMIPVGEKSESKIAELKNKKKSSFGNFFSDQKWSQEIWVMYQLRSSKINPKSQFLISNKISNPKLKKLQDSINLNKKITIISAWRYPGVSSEKDPIPAEIWREIEEMGILK